MKPKRLWDWVFVAFVVGLIAYTIGVEVLRVKALWALGTMPPVTRQ